MVGSDCFDIFDVRRSILRLAIRLQKSRRVVDGGRGRGLSDVHLLRSLCCQFCYKSLLSYVVEVGVSEGLNRSQSFRGCHFQHVLEEIKPFRGNLPKVSEL